MGISLREVEAAPSQTFIGRWRHEIDSIDVSLPPPLRRRDGPSRENVAQDIAITACAIVALLLVPGLLLLTNAR
jgi:hypothetical protein